jgi:hypothetical protein
MCLCSVTTSLFVVQSNTVSFKRCDIYRSFIHSLGQITVSSRSDHRQITVRSPSDHGQDTFRLWSGHVQIMVRTRSGHGQDTVRTRSDHGQDTVRSRSVHSQITVSSRSRNTLSVFKCICYIKRSRSRYGTLKISFERISERKEIRLPPNFT